MKKTLILFVLLCANIVAWGQTEFGAERLRKANAGDAEAQWWVSWYYKDGKEGFPVNEEESIKWLKKSAENGYAWAQLDLGELFRRGKRGFPKDKDEYLKWCRRAANGGYIAAYFSLGTYYEDVNKQEAIYWLKKFMDGWYKSTGEEEELAAEELRKLGVYYHPGSQSSATASSSSSSSSSSSGRSGSSSSSSSSGLLCKGTYTVSSQGYCAELGGYQDFFGSDFVVDVEIYYDYITVLSSRYNYNSTSGNWRIYGGDDDWMGGKTYYYVDMSNYEMKKISSAFNTFTGGRNIFTYSMAKGDTYIPKVTNSGNGLPGGTGGNTGRVNSGSSGSSRSSSSSSMKRACAVCQYTNGKCVVCKGTGKIHKSSYGVEGYGRCDDCGGTGRCKVCGGTGYRN